MCQKLLCIVTRFSLTCFIQGSAKYKVGNLNKVGILNKVDILNKVGILKKVGILDIEALSQVMNSKEESHYNQLMCRYDTVRYYGTYVMLIFRL